MAYYPTPSEIDDMIGVELRYLAPDWSVFGIEVTPMGEKMGVAVCASRGFGRVDRMILDFSLVRDEREAWGSPHPRLRHISPLIPFGDRPPMYGEGILSLIQARPDDRVYQWGQWGRCIVAVDHHNVPTACFHLGKVVDLTTGENTELLEQYHVIVQSRLSVI